MGRNKLLRGTHNPLNFFRASKYKRDFLEAHPEYFHPEGLLIFCGPQGSGKTLSAVQYCRGILEKYPDCIFVSNVKIDGISNPDRVHEYEGIESLSKYENGYAGVLYLIDEIHLEFNSLESQDISIEEMMEFAQQRKQRKHIVGTSQVYGRIAKPLREQMRRVVLCSNIGGLIQFNDEIDGYKTTEKDGKIVTESVGKYMWFHTPELYQCYDTYAKMKRYKKEWKGRSNRYLSSSSIKNFVSF